MDIKKSEEQLLHIDSFLTTLTKILNKHWLLLIFIVLFVLGYFVITLPDEPQPVQIEYVYEGVDSIYDGDSDTLSE